jgi:hypothetical protein
MLNVAPGDSIYLTDIDPADGNHGYVIRVEREDGIETVIADFGGRHTDGTPSYGRIPIHPETGFAKHVRHVVNG